MRQRNLAILGGEGGYPADFMSQRRAHHPRSLWVPRHLGLDRENLEIQNPNIQGYFASWVSYRSRWV